MEPSRISMIAAMGDTTRAIGRNNDLIWKGLSLDLKRFAALTRGNVVIMGKNTWFSLPLEHRPLKNRLNIVLSTDPDAVFEGALTAHSLEEAIQLAHDTAPGKEVFLIGGQSVYEKGIGLADRLYLTLIHSDEDGDVHFPSYDEFSSVIEQEKVTDNGLELTFLTLELPVL